MVVNFFNKLFNALILLFIFLVFWYFLPVNTKVKLISSYHKVLIDYHLLQAKPVVILEEAPESDNVFSVAQSDVNTSLNARAEPFLLGNKAQETLFQRKLLKWKDAQGKVHYGETMPQDSTVTLLDIINQDILRAPLTINLIEEGFTLAKHDRQKIELALNRTALFFSEMLGVTLPDTLAFNLKLFNDWDEFERYQKQTAPTLEFATGFYLPKNQEAVVWKNTNFDEMFKVMLHESVHAILHQIFPYAPLWMHEGLAEYFEQGVVTGQAIMIAPQADWEKLLILAEEKGRLWPLDQMIAWKNTEKQSNYELDLAYSASWGIVYFLLSSTEGKRFFGDCLRHVRDQPLEKEDWLKFAQKYFEKGNDGFWKLFAIWIHQRKYAHHA